MTVTLSFPLPDGSISLDGVNIIRVSLVVRMARVLVDEECFSDHADSIQALVSSGRFSYFDILVCIDDARQTAMQHVVAMEMAWS